jgi:hypothetical protein
MRHAWRAGALSALLLFLFFGDAPEHTRFWSACFDAGHTALFGVIALLVDGWLAATGGWRARARRPLVAFGLTVALGAATELLQTLQARGDPSLVDLLRDTAGAASFLLLAWTARTRSETGHRRLRVAAVTAALALLLAAGWTLLVTSARYVARDRAVPTLFALDGSWWESDFVELGANRLTPLARAAGGQDGPPLARLDLEPGLYSGVTFDEPYPDWRGRRRLVFTVASDLPEPLALVVRVHDAAHDQRYADRFNRRFVIAPGVNRVTIPIDDILHAPDRRLMDLGRIRGIVIFAYALERPTHLFLGPLRLE